MAAPHARSRAWTAASLAPVLAAVLAAGLVTGCASDGVTRPESAASPRPEGLDDMRAALADRREATRDLMETNLERPAARGAGAPASSTGASILSFLGDVTDTALEVLSLRTFGVW